MKNKPFTFNQAGAFITLLIVAVWGVWTSSLHMTRPLGIEFVEILFLGALVPGYVLLLPFYLGRVRWSYLNGIVVNLGFMAGLGKSLMDQSFFFTVIPYNLITVVVILAVLGGIYFSVRAFLELPRQSWASAIGVIVLLAVSATAVVWLSINQNTVENYKTRQIVNGVHARTDDIETLSQKIETLMAEGDMQSLVAAIVVNDEIVWIQGFGEDPARDNLYDIGSATKPFIATAVLQLYEQGLIDLDDDVNDYLPFSVHHPDYPEIPITFRMLLTNRSCLAHRTNLYWTYMMGASLREWGVKNRGWESQDEYESLTYPDFMVEYLAPGGSYHTPEVWAKCKPDTNFVYSTSGFDLLGFLIEQISGQPLNAYLQGNIFDPLQMSNTTATPLDTSEQMATPFERWYGVLSKRNVELPFSQRPRIGGGGLYSTATDLANFTIAQINQGKFLRFQLLMPENIDLMHTLESETNGDFLQVGYGYGWGIFRDDPWQMWDMTFKPHGFQGHGGRYLGYSSAMYMVQEEVGGYGYVMLMNTGMTESQDMPWFFSIQFNIQDSLLQEAQRLYQASHNE